MRAAALERAGSSCGSRGSTTGMGVPSEMAASPSTEERQGLVREGRAVGVEPSRSAQRVMLALLLAGAAALAVATAARVAPTGARRNSTGAGLQSGRTLLQERGGDVPDGYAEQPKKAHEHKVAPNRHAQDGAYVDSSGASSGSWSPATAPAPAPGTAYGGGAAAPAAANGGGTGGACLCVFDVDRTLTAKQHHKDECQFTWDEEDAYDGAFGGGPMLLSYLGKSVSTSSCSSCQQGIVSNGDATGPKERAVLARQLGHDGAEFTNWKSASSPFLTGCPNGKKQECAKNLIAWYESQSISIDTSRVYLFDDLAENIAGFQGSGMHAHQISCGSRDKHDHSLGMCGGRPEELTLAPGVTFCS